MAHMTREEIREYLLDIADYMIENLEYADVPDEYFPEWDGKSAVPGSEILNIQIGLSFQSNEKKAKPWLRYANVCIGDRAWDKFKTERFEYYDGTVDLPHWTDWEEE